MMCVVGSTVTLRNKINQYVNLFVAALKKFTEQINVVNIHKIIIFVATFFSRQIPEPIPSYRASCVVGSVVYHQLTMNREAL
jgi:hypothetical protein